MSAPVSQLAEAASLAEPVESLLLDELQDLGLDSLPQLAAAPDTGRGAESEIQPAHEAASRSDAGARALT